MNVFFATLFFMMVCPFTSQSQVTDDFRPSSTNQAGREYPQVNSEGRVRAQISAPDAKYVQLDIGGASVPDPGSMMFFGACRWGSGGGYNPDDLKDHHNLKLGFLSCGSKERPDGVNRAAADLKEADINAVSYISDGTAHEFHTCIHQIRL